MKSQLQMEIIDNYFRDIQAMTVEGVRKNPDAAFAAKEYFKYLCIWNVSVTMPAISASGLSTSNLVKSLNCRQSFQSML